MMERAKHELANDDTSITTLLSAMAVEGEMAYLFFKWKGIDSGTFPVSSSDKSAWEAEWVDMRSINRRLDELSRLLTNDNFDQVAMRHEAYSSLALQGFNPATSIKKFFQDYLFDKRNRIAHYGDINLEKPEGTQCFTLALELIRLLHAMDKERIKKMDDADKMARESTLGSGS